MPVTHRPSDCDLLPESDSGSEGRGDGGKRICVKCKGCGQRFDSEAMLRRHRNSGKLASGNACKGAAFTGPYLSASGSIRRSTGTGGQSMQRSRGDASDLLAGNDSDASVQDFVPPSMQVHTDTMRVHILFQNNQKSPPECTHCIIEIDSVHKIYQECTID